MSIITPKTPNPFFELSAGTIIGPFIGTGSILGAFSGKGWPQLGQLVAKQLISLWQVGQIIKFGLDSFWVTIGKFWLEGDKLFSVIIFFWAKLASVGLPQCLQNAAVLETSFPQFLHR